MVSDLKAATAKKQNHPLACPTLMSSVYSALKRQGFGGQRPEGLHPPRSRTPHSPTLHSCPMSMFCIKKDKKLADPMLNVVSSSGCMYIYMYIQTHIYIHVHKHVHIVLCVNRYFPIYLFFFFCLCLPSIHSIIPLWELS